MRTLPTVLPLMGAPGEKPWVVLTVGTPLASQGQASLLLVGLTLKCKDRQTSLGIQTETKGIEETLWDLLGVGRCGTNTFLRKGK